MTISFTKSKVMKFSRSGLKSKEKWLCGSEYMEEVGTFTYLGFTFQGNGAFTHHIRRLASNGKKRTSLVWSLAESDFKDSFLIRKQMYYSLVQPTFTFECEVFGFKEYVELERVQRMYFRWTLGLAPWTKICLLYDETKTTPVHVTSVARALRYEEKARESPCIILQECVRYRLDGPHSTPTERTSFVNRCGFSEQLVRGDPQANRTLVGRRMDRFLQLHCSGLQGTQDRSVRRNGLARCLRQARDIKMVSRFRLQNEEKALQSWREDTSCRVCYKAPETLDHILACSGLSGTAREILDESGTGASLMRKIIKWRKAHQIVSPN